MHGNRITCLNFGGRSGRTSFFLRLSIRVDARGRVGHIEVVESSGFAALDRAAEKAVRYTRFVPAAVGDRPVPDDLTITIRFRLDS